MRMMTVQYSSSSLYYRLPEVYDADFWLSVEVFPLSQAEYEVKSDVTPVECINGYRLCHTRKLPNGDTEYLATGSSMIVDYLAVAAVRR